MVEMSQGLAEEEDGEAHVEQPVARPTKPKTRRQKIKVKILKLREFRRLKSKTTKKRMNALNRLTCFFLFKIFFVILKKKNLIFENF